MKNIIILTANAKTDVNSSASLNMAQYTKSKLEEKYPEAKIVERNLVHENIPELTETILTGNLTENDYKILEQRTGYLNEFLEADLVVFSMPMWNHSYPAAFKSYMDTIWAAKVTFAYNESGDIYGLLENSDKKILIIASMGGMNSFKGNDFGYLYAKDSFISFGLKEAAIKYVPVQGTALYPQDNHSMAIGIDQALVDGKKLIDFTLTSYK